MFFKDPAQTGYRFKVVWKVLLHDEEYVLNKLVEDFNELTFGDKECAVQLIQKQLIEAKREGITIRAREVMSTHKKGKVKRVVVGDLLKDLEND